MALFARGRALAPEKAQGILKNPQKEGIGVERTASNEKRETLKKGATRWERFRRQLPYQLMIWPGMIFLVIFAYIPIAGLVIAFQDYSLSTSYFNNPWVGLKHFQSFLKDTTFWMAFRNTIQLSLLRMCIVFPMPILLALALNEIPSLKLKKTVQTCSYFPHFMAYVVVAALWQDVLSNNGLINNLLMQVGLTSEPISFWTDPAKFKGLATFVELWKGTGWSAIIYFAAISGINSELYEAAKIDGAGRFAQIRYITIPEITNTIIIMFILSIGGLVSGNLSVSQLLGNAFTKSESYIIEYYTLEMGLRTMRYSFATAVGMFQSVISVFLVLLANFFSKKYEDVGLF